MFRQLAIACAAALALASVAVAQVNQPTTGTSGGHVTVPGSGGLPALSSCGSSPSPSINPSSTDYIGQITVGNASGTTTACTVTFFQPYNSAPFCDLNVNSGVRASMFVTIAAASFTVTGLNGGDTFTYNCIARVGG